MPNILLVDDDPHCLDSTRRILELAGYTVDTARDGRSALDRLQSEASTAVDLVVSDVRMPGMGGMEFLRAVSVCGEGVPVLLMTAFGRVEEAVDAMKLGAIDFLTKPFKRQALLSAVESALQSVTKKSPIRSDSGTQAFEGWIGNSPSIKLLRETIARVASSDSSVLIHGESGSGKELAARTIHRLSARASQPFIAINCAAMPAPLIESELFGHERGAFSGATQAKAGLFEAADTGTLLLDEIAELPLDLQAKLLRVLQESEVRRIGATRSRAISVRVISATNVNLRDAVKRGVFREDLYFRLDVIQLEVPPLREHAGDIAALAERFTRGEATLSYQALQVLEAYRWPGNVRELSNAITRALVFRRGQVIEPEDLPPHIVAHAHGAHRDPSTIGVSVGTPLRDVEDLLIQKTLEATSGDKLLAAKLLGVNSRTIYRKLERKNRKDRPLDADE